MNKEQNVIHQKKVKSKIVLELFIILGSCVAVYIVATCCDILESIVGYSRQHENWELDEVITVSVFLVGALAIFSIRRLRELRRSSIILSERNEQLHKAFSEIKQLKGIVPICASCKNIRDDKGFWQQVENFVSNNTEAVFSHGICPDCSRKLYPDLYEDKLKKED
jgi:ABC-type nickel/cobalt efflux system permease component RcnA